MRRRPKKFRAEKPTAGQANERIFTDRLRKEWGLFVGERLDRRDKVDNRIEWRKHSRIPCPIETQVTSDANSYLKLASFIKKHGQRLNGAVKVYVVVHNNTPFEIAAECASRMYLRDLLRPGVANKLMLLDVRSGTDCGWADIYARKNELELEHLQRLHNGERKRGVVIASFSNKTGCVIRSGFHRYFAGYSGLADKGLYEQLKNGGIPVGTKVTFTPTKKISNGPHLFAESVLPA